MTSEPIDWDLAVATAALAGGLVAFAMGPPRVSQGRPQVWHVRPGSSGTGSAVGGAATGCKVLSM